ncbi:dienelactone hydrolase family protein [Thiothrix litoralis]|jgi:carboxymethylenebutenolidase|uniref:Dienelactone hydrolase family protein n=1 Tax=Thiothrix litoralis TaxID=2891210 RepID=A0ABX7WP78_9GAMM|nr:dienelactone hydrolase family protein [Thiothrix litoralis]QTR45172.1 dienelactone hydrolase family protein [Thiothrix litoralis]
MDKQTQIQIPQEAFDWYDEYAHGGIDRRTFLARLGSLAITGLTIGTISSALLPNYALAEQVSFNDETIKASYVEFASPKGYGKGRGYLVTPKLLEGKAPVVLVVHENRGLNPYIEDVARRLAKLGYVAFAPDALYSLGGYPGNDDAGREMQKSLDPAKIEADFIAAAGFLKTHESSNGKLGVVGFCFGGYITNMLAASLPEVVNAGVPFYGTPPKSGIENIKAPLMLQFGELDERVNATWPEYEAALKASKVDYQAFVYPGVNHGFHNDSTARYNKEAAELAWSRTVAFFGKHLQA